MTKSVFAYRNGFLCAEALPLAELVEEIDTPFFCISAKQLRRNYDFYAAPLAEAGAAVQYALRVNPSLAVMNVLASCGAGCEVTTSGELERALMAQVPVHQITMAGSGKNQDDIAAALLANVKHLTACCFSELSLIDRVALILGKCASVSLLISLGGVGGTLGFDVDEIGQALSSIMDSENLTFNGFSLQMPFRHDEKIDIRAACEKLALLTGLFRAQGFEVPHVELGGEGLLSSCAQGPSYPAAIASIIKEILEPCGCPLSVNLGASLVADAGVLVSRIVHIKKDASGKSLFLDVGGYEGLQSALQNMRHEIIAVRDNKHGMSTEQVRVMNAVGDSANESGSSMYTMPTVMEGDTVAIMRTGAYNGAVLSCCNGRPLIPEVLVSGAQHAVVRRRIAVAEQIEWETIPEWMVVGRAA